MNLGVIIIFPIFIISNYFLKPISEIKCTPKENPNIKIVYTLFETEDNKPSSGVATYILIRVYENDIETNSEIIFAVFKNISQAKEFINFLKKYTILPSTSEAVF